MYSHPIHTESDSGSLGGHPDQVPEDVKRLRDAKIAAEEASQELARAWRNEEISKQEAIGMASEAWKLWARVYDLEGNVNHRNRCQDAGDNPPEDVPTVLVGMTYTHRAYAEPDMYYHNIGE